MIFVEFSSEANVAPQKKPLEGGVFITHARLVTGPWASSEFVLQTNTGGTQAAGLGDGVSLGIDVIHWQWAKVITGCCHIAIDLGGRWSAPDQRRSCGATVISDAIGTVGARGTHRSICIRGDVFQFNRISFTEEALLRWVCNSVKLSGRGSCFGHQVSAQVLHHLTQRQYPMQTVINETEWLYEFCIVLQTQLRQ